jgi:glycosyltransferase involved in cell wall biosynthesis
MQDPKPKISIITPVYNGLPYLIECVESVLSQEERDWEMLISDDGSRDESRKYLSTLTDPRIKVTFQEKNLGIFGNLNFLFAKAKAPLSYILCQDDYFLPRGLSAILDKWQHQNSDLAFICFNRPTSGHNCIKNLPEFITPQKSDLYFYLYGNIPGNLSNVSLRTNIPEQHGWFNQSFPFVGDFEFWSRVGRIQPFLQTSEPVSFVRRHEGVASIHLNLKGEYVKQIFDVANTLYDNLVVTFDPWRLKLHGTIVYDGQERYIGVSRLVRIHNATYLREVVLHAKNSRFVFNSSIHWIILVLTLGSHVFRGLGIKAILSQDSRSKRTSSCRSQQYTQIDEAN